MTGLFSRGTGDSRQKKNRRKLEEIKKLVREKKYPRALQLGTEYLKKVPDHHDLLFTVGGIYYLQGRYKTAISYFERALEIGNYDVEVLLLKAYSHQRLGQPKRAVQCCERIKEIDPKSKSVAKLLYELDSDL